MFLFSPLFWVFVGVPILEIWLFLVVGRRIGIFMTVGMVVLTAAVGSTLMRRQGMAVLRRAQEMVGHGRLPARELIDGVMILAAGLLLLTPGFFTDAIGFTLLVPPARAAIRELVKARLQARLIVRRPRASQMEFVDDSASDDEESLRPNKPEDPPQLEE